MMALFIVLWLLTQTDQASRQKIAQYFRTGVLPGGSLVSGKPSGSNPPVAVDIFDEGHPPQSPSEAQELDALKASVEKMMKGASGDAELAELAKHVKIKIVDEGALIELVDGGDSFMFPVASASLKQVAVQFLEKLGPLLAKTDNKIEIHGHTDSRPYDPKGGKTNWDLSYERANRARQVLEAHGLPSGKINGVLAHADSALLNPDNPYAPENRRLAILVVRKHREQERAGNVPAAKP
jgi:chemotaxis protein MotB